MSQEALQNAFAYLPKPFAAMSMLSSIVLLREVLADQRKTQRNKTIPRVLLSMSIADIIFSIAIFLGSWPIPVDAAPEDIVGNVGNQATCQLQAFMFQLGVFASPVFNAALSFVYLLIIRFNFSERKLRRLEPWFQVAVWLLSLALAVFPIPFGLYNSNGSFCWLSPFPFQCEMKPDVPCTRGPDAHYYALAMRLCAWVCLAESTVVMFLVLMKVVRQENKSGKYAGSLLPPPRTEALRGSSTRDFAQQQSYNSKSTTTLGRKDSLRALSRSINRTKSRAVAMQSICYTLAFLLTFFPDAIAQVLAAADRRVVVFDLIAYSFFLPLAGFFNMVVYARPKTQMSTREGRLWRKVVFCCDLCSQRKTGMVGGTPAVTSSRSEVELSLSRANVDNRATSQDNQQRSTAMYDNGNGEKGENSTAEIKLSAAQISGEPLVGIAVHSVDLAMANASGARRDISDLGTDETYHQLASSDADLEDANQQSDAPHHQPFALNDETVDPSDDADDVETALHKYLGKRNSS